MIHTIVLPEGWGALEKLLQRHLPKEELLSGELRLCSIQQGGSQQVQVQAAGAAQTLLLAGALAELLLGEWQVRYLAGRIRSRYGGPPTIQKRLLLRTLKAVRAEERAWEQEALTQELAKWLLCERAPLRPDAWLLFRMQDQRAAWDALLAEQAAALEEAEQYAELLRSLRCLAALHDPALEYVCICPEGEEYILRDRAGRQVLLPAEAWEEEDTPVDRLLTRLIRLSPAYICAAAVEDGELLSLLQQVFIGRVHKAPLPEA